MSFLSISKKRKPAGSLTPFSSKKIRPGGGSLARGGQTGRPRFVPLPRQNHLAASTTTFVQNQYQRAGNYLSKLAAPAHVSQEQLNPYSSSGRGSVTHQNASKEFSMKRDGDKPLSGSNFDIRERANPFQMELESESPARLPEEARYSVVQRCVLSVTSAIRYAVWYVFENFTMLGIGLLVVMAILPSHFSLTLTPSMLLLVLGGVYIGRSVWFSLPKWLQKHMSGEVGDEPEDANDELASPVAIMKKLNDMFNLTYKHSDDLWPDDMPQYKIYICVISLLHLLKELFHAHPDWRNKERRHEGNPVSEEELRDLEFYLNFADLAYEESPTETIIKLRPTGYCLMRHDVATEPGRVGHFIAVNHEKREVVIALKGTSSVSDVLTDLIGMAKPHTLANGKKIRCHEGMYTAALMMADECQHMIENFFLPAGYNIKICGHSLGAGTACLLGVFLKSRGFPVRVYAFATPACLSLEASMDCRDYITSVVNNSDCVPRVSLVNIRTLNKLFLKIDQKLTHRGLSPNDWVSTRAYFSDISKVDNDLLLTPEEIHDFQEVATRAEDGNDDYSLFVAGRVVSMWVCNTATGEEPDVDCRQLHGGMKTLRNIEVSRSMLHDHGTEPYKANLRALREKAAAAGLAKFR